MSLAWAAVALVLGAACSGPRSPIELSMKQVPGDVLLGSRAQTTAPDTIVELPSAVNPEPVGFPSFLQSPPPVRPQRIDTGNGAPPTTTTAPEPPPPACPAGDLLTPPANEASKNVSSPPRAATFVYRNDGSYEVVDAQGRKDGGRYPAESRRLVEPTEKAVDGTFSFAVSEELAGRRTTTTYFVDPASGIYLAGMVTREPDGSTDRFVPADPRSLVILPLPAREHLKFEGRGVDPLQRTSMTITGQVGVRIRVDACGAPLSGWEVKILDGRIRGTNKQVEFTANYVIGTQYGGLVLRDAVDVRCDSQVSVFCDNGRRVTSKNTATISSEPIVVEGSS